MTAGRRRIATGNSAARRNELQADAAAPRRGFHQADEKRTMAEEIRNVVIMGSGCSGLTAAIYAGRANLKPLLLEGHEPGGQLSMTTLVENFPGWPEGIQGPELIENMRHQAARFGTEFRCGHVTAADLTQRPFVLTVGQGADPDAHADHRQRGQCALAGAAQREGADRPRSLLLRHLRRLLLQRQGDHGDRRRRLGDGRGAVPDALRQQGYAHPSPRRLPRQQDHAGPRPRPREDPLS